MNQSDQTLLRITDLSVAFRQGDKETTAVDKVSLDIGKGETHALVGESGSGKSVTALSILKLLPNSAVVPKTSSVLFKGEEMLDSDDSDLRRVRGNDVTFIFQEPMTSLNPLHTIEKQLAEILELHRGLTGEEARSETLELLDKVGIRDAESRLGSFPHQLSGGQRQRVMIAMALANKPDLLIADEPTTALDVTVQAQILDLLKQLQAEMGMAVLLITHDLGIVRKMADRVSVMQQGKIVETGETAGLFANPQHPYTKHLIDAEPKGLPPKADHQVKPIVAADNVKVWFPIKRGFFRRTVGHVKAVDGISVKVREGQTIGVVGESGSGKTTLGLALLRLIQSEGRIAYADKNIETYDARDMRPLRQEMQVVFQDPYGSLSPRLSILQIVEEGLVVQGRMKDADERRHAVAKALLEVGLEDDVMDRYPHEFSGGQRQRIAIARAMVLEPRFVVLDEPTSALDMSVQAQIVDLLRKLQQDHNLGYMFISHDLKVVRAMANDVVVMRMGQVVEQGPAEQIFSNPETDYTKALMAAAFDLEAGPTGAAQQ